MRAAWLVFLLTVFVGQAVAQDETQVSLADYPVSLESQPYRVRILIAQDVEDASPLERELSQALDRSVGSLWTTEIATLPDVVRPQAKVLERWTMADVRERFDDDGVDFWFAVTVRDTAARREIAVRAWQPQFDWLSPVHASATYEPRETAGQIVRRCWNLFRPQVLVDHVDQQAVRVRVRAGDLVPADPAFTLFQSGDFLVPWLMYYDREKALRKKQELPWTYVRLDSLKGPLGEGTSLSGLRNPLASKTRGRIEKVAVASRPVYPQTRLQIGVQNQPARTLAGYRLELRPKLAPPKSEKKDDKQNENRIEQPKDEVTEVFTDRLGEVMLLPDPRHPQIWIYIYSGELLLARVPFVPGSLPFLRLDVPDDSVRLQAEGELQSLQSELINLVAERNTLIAAARSASKKGDWQRVKLLRQQIDELPVKEKFIARLAGIRVPAVNAARQRKDRIAQTRIERLCNDVNELIERYLDAEKLQLIKDEIDQLTRDAQAEVK
jgi:hypothetical protein